MLMESDRSSKTRCLWVKSLVLSLCILLSVTGFTDTAFAQNSQGKGVSGAPANPRITIKGRITDDHDEPLPGANVLVKGTSIGTSADADGNYSLTFQRSPGKSDILIYSFIGTESKEYNVSTSTRLNVQLKTSSLDAVVVNGFYTQTKETFTGAATTISGDQLVAVSSTNLMQSLASLTPGMVLVENNAAGSNPNAVPSILIRGANTLITNESEEGVNNPLIVLDGVEISIQELYDLDMFDIERIDVLKDASATILYGEKGANGVIVVERKRSEEGKLRLSYNFVPKFSVPDLSSFNLCSPAEKLEVERLAGKYDNADGSMDEAYDYKLQLVRRGVNPDWLHAPLRVPFSHTHSLALSSRGEKLEFRANANFGDTYGVMKGDNRRNLGLNFSINYHLRNKLTLSYKNSFSLNRSVDSPYGSYSQYSRMNPYLPMTDEDGEYYKYYTFNPFSTSGTKISNPLYEATLSSFSKSQTQSWTNSLSGRWNITKDLYVTGQANLGLSWSKADTYESPDMAKYENSKLADKGRYSLATGNGLSTDGKIVINYGRSLDTKGSMFRISAGSNIQYGRKQNASFIATGFIKDELSDLSFALSYPTGHPSGSDKVSTGVGVFANANFSLWNRYFVDGSYRASGSSKFGSRNSFAPFWAFGAGWHLHNEKFIKDNLPWVNTLTFRYSMGYTGSVSFDYYQARTVYQYDSKYQYVSGIGALPKQMGNPDLKWQRTFNNNFGITAAFLDNRFNLSFDFYSNTTYDMLMPVTLPPSVGTSSMNVNFGQMNNKGLDLSVSGQIIRTKDLFWSMTLTGGHVMDKIQKISDDIKDDITNPYDSSKPNILLQEGGSQYDIFAMRSAGIDPATGKEIFIKKNGEYTYHYDRDERVAVGNTNPTLQGSWMNTVRYKGFSVSIATTYTFGSDYYNSTLQNKVENINPEINVDRRVFTDRWKQPGDHTRFLGIGTSTSITQYSERFVEKRNELYISSIQLMYDFAPKAITRLGLRKLAVGIGLSDIAHISTVKFERGTSYPYCRGINLIFRPTF